MTDAARWVRFRTAARVGFGILEGSRIVEYTGDLFDSPRPTGVHIDSGYDLLAPCVPSKIIALWNNFHALAAKLAKPAPTHALYLLKPASCIAGPRDAIRRPTGYAGRILYEGELGIVIGRTCRDVSIEDAPRHIFGYTCVNDVTAGDLLDQSPDFAQWCRSKGSDTFGIIGPSIATQLDWSQERVITRLDGVERQNYALSDMILTPHRLVSQISHDMTLLPGDVIACGTSLGVGSIRDGVDVDVCIEGIGSLTNALLPCPKAADVP